MTWMLRRGNFTCQGAPEEYNKNLEEALEWGVKLLPKDTGVGIIAIRNDGQIYGTSNTSMPFSIIED